MASSRQEYFILRNDVPIAKTNNFLRNLLGTLEHVLKGELLVKEALPQDGNHQSHAIYSLALDRNTKVSCSNSDVAPLSEDDYKWLVAIGKTIDRWQFYTLQDKLEAVKKLRVGDNVWVALPVGDEIPHHLVGSSCCLATVQYIGPLQDTPGRWVGVELKEKRGYSDGSFRDARYFMCEVDHGAFLPATNILTVSQSSSAPPIPTSSTPTLQGPHSTRKKLLVSATQNKTDRDFYLDDPVVVFDKDGRRVPGVAKWAVSGKERGVDCYIIGIETDMPIKKEKVERHISSMSHLFPHTRDHKKHTYLAIPELSVLKEGDWTPTDAGSEVMDVTSPPAVTESVHAVASTVAKNIRSSTAAVLREQAQALKESELKKEEAAKKKLADKFGVAPEEVDAQREQYKKLERQQSLNNQKRELYPAPDVTESVRAVASTRSTTAAESQPQPTQPLLHHLVSHNLDVGSAVELVDPPGYGIIRWIGKFPGVNPDIAGVELDMKVDGCGDGSWNNKRYFTCKDGHAVFIVLSKLKPGQRHRKRHSSGGEPTVQTRCSCECKLVKDQVTEIKTNVHHNNELISTVKGQVGSCEEALQAKDQQIERLQSEVQALQHTSICLQERNVTERRQLREELATVRDAKNQQTEELQQTIASFQEASVTERRQLREELATVRGQLVSCEDTKEELKQTIADLRQERIQRENEFTARLSAIEAQMRALLPPWAIPETELEVTETVLGKGAYGEVRLGVYHGDRVAVKRLHNVIASDYYHKMIQREMGIAARLRHPKLVLFIGAVTRGNLTIVTELMETSLRSELEHGRLKEDHILSISRDVACALCYLHSLPEPIIHRDVSSANVLLNSTKEGWVAKLGDYGSANFQAKLQTVGPGCPVYAAPEASRPEEQGPKMDVYSYGVLVLEMCTGTLPDPRDLPVIQQAVHSWRQPKRQLGGLACQCTLQSSDRRPHMRNVVTQLNGM